MNPDRFSGAGTSWMNFKFHLTAAFFCGLLLISCSSQKLPERELPIERDGQTIAVVKAEVAQTQEDRSRGLMFRKNLDNGKGMLFVFEKDEILSFWMKNTLIPLSIAFISSGGRIIEIKDMYPGDLNPVTSSRSARYALEAPQGWFAHAGVQNGDTVIINID